LTSEVIDGPPVLSDSSRAPQKEECRHTKNLSLIKCRFFHALLCAGAKCVQAFQVLLVRGKSFLIPMRGVLARVALALCMLLIGTNKNRRCMQEASNSFLCMLNLLIPACHMLALLRTSRETLFKSGVCAGLHRALLSSSDSSHKSCKAL
jgi:hypothetical protein